MIMKLHALFQEISQKIKLCGDLIDMYGVEFEAASDVISLRSILTCNLSI